MAGSMQITRQAQRQLAAVTVALVASAVAVGSVRWHREQESSSVALYRDQRRLLVLGWSRVAAPLRLMTTGLSLARKASVAFPMALVTDMHRHVLDQVCMLGMATPLFQLLLLQIMVMVVTAAFTRLQLICTAPQGARQLYL